ncbi:MAG: hypothetical protein A2275_11995 [Bacteroidetes bacterium RIFOXYA12_FULL_35_11]|nr:MAG: hypothetical protein A2X01_16955 [Bacteroidetes bacterium GWF2_35_48]OFY82510.1 MAG: hypothetical protein A2275_11995 [Bacteroidetes bacterium RIFOXYA12_FULL_35_11]HBX53372.1 hypothetical protein [Bacteroidales bacterium]
MKQIVLTIPENKISFFMELVRNFKFIKIEQTADVNESEIIEGIRQGLKEVQLIEQGKMNATPLKDFLNEL